MQFEYIGITDSTVEESDYQKIWDYQHRLHEEVAKGESPDTVIFVQHSPVYTAGRRTEPQEKPFDGTPVIDVDRGGKITYHGPGQLVGYPITRLPEKIGVVDYVRRLEEAIIRPLAKLGVRTGRVPGRTGVWLPATKNHLERKICAIGVKVSKRTTLHGFALNIFNVSLRPFHNIIPCGIADAEVTCIEKELGTAPTLFSMAKLLEPSLTELLSYKTFTKSPDISNW